MVDLAPGQSISKHLQLISLLREGAMGSVWVAEHLPSTRKVAVKFVASSQLHDSARARSLRARGQGGCPRSPAPTWSRRWGMAARRTARRSSFMELLDGESLGDRLERGPLGLPEATAVLRQVGNALDAAHMHGTIHRDIKPDNIFLVRGPELFAKVLDFGMAKQWREQDEELTATGVAVGTPEYMSPEQVLGSRDVDFRADLWALAAVVYRCLAGSVPFTGDTPHSLIFEICKGQFVPLDQTSAPASATLTAWFQRAFTPAKEKRFGSAREMALTFEQATADIDSLFEDSFDYEESTQLIDVGEMRASQLGAMASPIGDEDTTDSMAETRDFGDEEMVTQQLEPSAARAAIEAVLAAQRARRSSQAPPSSKPGASKPPDESVSMPTPVRPPPGEGAYSYVASDAPKARPGKPRPPAMSSPDGGLPGIVRGPTVPPSSRPRPRSRLRARRAGAIASWRARLRPIRRVAAARLGPLAARLSSRCGVASVPARRARLVPQPTGTQPTGTQPTGTQPTGTQPTGTQPTGTQPTGTQPTGTQPTGTQPTGTQPTGTQPTGTQPTGPARGFGISAWRARVVALPRVASRGSARRRLQPGYVHLGRAPHGRGVGRSPTLIAAVVVELHRRCRRPEQEGRRAQVAPRGAGAGGRGGRLRGVWPAVVAAAGRWPACLG